MDMNRILVASAMFAGCVPAPVTGQHTAALAASANVRDYGAVGDGVTDDRAAIQATLTAAAPGVIVYVPNGVYLVGKGGGAWCLTVQAGVTLRGESRDGAVLLQAPGIAGSVRLLEVDSPSVTITTLTLDGDRALQTADEHRAGAFVTAADVTVRDVTARAFSGDGLYFYGGSDRFVVDNVLSIGHGRNGMTVGGVSAGGRVINSQFFDSHAQQFDSEPGAVAVISDLTISGSTFDGRGSSTDYAVTVSGGASTARAHDWLIRDNVINGGLHTVWADRIVIRHNIGTNQTGRPHVSLYRTGFDNVIEDNDLTTTGTGDMVNLTATGEGGPMRSMVRRNRLHGGIMGVHAEGGVSVEVTDNDIAGPGVLSGGSGVYLRATDPTRPFAYAVVRRNRVSNFGRIGMAIDGNGAAQLAYLDVTDNVFFDSSGTMLGAMALNYDGTNAARDVVINGNVLLGGCVTKLVGPPPAGALTTGMGQRWQVP